MSGEGFYPPISSLSVSPPESPLSTSGQPPASSCLVYLDHIHRITSHLDIGQSYPPDRAHAPEVTLVPIPPQPGNHDESVCLILEADLVAQLLIIRCERHLFFSKQALSSLLALCLVIKRLDNQVQVRRPVIGQQRHSVDLVCLPGTITLFSSCF